MFALRTLALVQVAAARESTFIHLRNLLMTVALIGPTAQLVRIDRQSSVVISHALNRALQFG